MTAFALIGAAIAVLALVMLLRPLLRTRGSAVLSSRDANISIYKDQLRELEVERAAGTLSEADFDKSRLELEARLLDDVSAPETPAARSGGPRMALIVGLAVPLLAVGVYLFTGNPGGFDPHQGMPDAAQVDAMVERLAAKLRENPDDAEGWKLLGRSYTAMGKFPEAVGAFAKAAERSPRDAQLLADFADALAMVHGRRLEGEPAKLIERALEIDPKNLKALALSGTVAFERKEYAKAAQTWSRMLPLVQADSEDARTITGNVEEARKLAGIGASASAPKLQAKAHPGIRGTVALSPELKKEVKPDDAVFVFARAAEGSPIPLAVLRAKAGELPLKFNLTDAMAMSPGMSVSAHARVVVTARVSKTGNAQVSKGDLQGASPPVANDAGGVTVLIDSVVR